MHEAFSVVYSGNIVQADLLKCLLERDGIQAFLEDEFLGRMVSSSRRATWTKPEELLRISQDGRLKRPNETFGW